MHSSHRRVVSSSRRGTQEVLTHSLFEDRSNHRTAKIYYLSDTPKASKTWLKKQAFWMKQTDSWGYKGAGWLFGSQVLNLQRTRDPLKPLERGSSLRVSSLRRRSVKSVASLRGCKTPSGGAERGGFARSGGKSQKMSEGCFTFYLSHVIFTIGFFLLPI